MSGDSDKVAFCCVKKEGIIGDEQVERGQEAERKDFRKVELAGTKISVDYECLGKSIPQVAA